MRSNASWGQRRGVNTPSRVPLEVVPAPASIQRQTRNTREALCGASGKSPNRSVLAFFGRGGGYHSWSSSPEPGPAKERKRESRVPRGPMCPPVRGPGLQGLLHSPWQTLHGARGLSRCPLLQAPRRDFGIWRWARPSHLVMVLGRADVRRLSDLPVARRLLESPRISAWPRRDCNL